MTPQEYLDHVAADSARFASASAGSLDQTIGFLGDWSIRDLVAHLGAVYSLVIANTRTPGLEQGSPGGDAQPPQGEAINEWFAERRNLLLTTLSAADDDAPSWTFVGPKTVGWWKRRMASETAVHRWDAEAATAEPADTEPIESELATDAVDEYLENSLRFSSSRPNRTYPIESLHLHRADGPGEWMLVGDGAGGVTVTNEHGKGDAAVRGPASDLLLWIWGRPTTGVEIFGDESVAATWQQLAP